LIQKYIIKNNIKHGGITMENKDNEVSEKVETVTYAKKDIEQVLMGLNQIPVSGLQNVNNMTAIFSILTNKVISE
jgi:hypothetical protein